MSRLHFVSYFLLLAFFSCTAPPPNVPYLQDVIPEITLTAGKTDSIFISDLFYAETCKAEFEPHPHLKIDYDTTSGWLVLTPERNFSGYTVVSFRHGSAIYRFPIKVKRSLEHTFRYVPTAQVKQVCVMGNFNNWNRSSLVMQRQPDGSFSLTQALDAGRYEYKFVVDGKEVLDPANSEKVPNGFGDFNSVLRLSPPQTEKLDLHIATCKTLGDETELAFLFERENMTGKLLSQHVVALIDNQLLGARQLKIVENRIVIRLKGNDMIGEKVLRLAVTQDGLSTPMQTVFLFNGLPMGMQSSLRKKSANLARENTPAPFNWHDAIIYSIIIDRFANGDSTNDKPLVQDSLYPPANYFGGDLRGIMQKLDEGYFDSLGVNVLWLSPVNKHPDRAYREYPPPHRYYSGYHGYWPVSATEVEPRFGDMDLLRRLIAKAHRRGMKVILDFIAHHTHLEHPFYQQHPEWFGKLDLPDGRKNLRLWDEHRLTTWFEPYLPSFDYASREALDTMSSNAVWWLKQTDADGFRHDAVKHVPNSFWRETTRKIKRDIQVPKKRRIYQIGETFGSYELIKSYINNGQLDAQFNFNLFYTARRVFLSPEESFTALDAELQKTFDVYGIRNLTGNIMDSHDQVRYIALADGDFDLNERTPKGLSAQDAAWLDPPRVDSPLSYEKTKLYLAYLLTIPGIPVLYYGDEIGLTGAADPDNRRPMRFGNQLSQQEKRMLEDVQRLVKLRASHPALRYGDFRTLLADKSCFAYLRCDFNERLLVVLNKSSVSQVCRLSLPRLYKASKAVNLLTQSSLEIEDSQLSLAVPAFGYAIFSIE
jgi:cyclomaltodextrinase